jgi:hypothetical protein
VGLFAAEQVNGLKGLVERTKGGLQQILNQLGAGGCGIRHNTPESSIKHAAFGKLLTCIAMLCRGGLLSGDQAD